MNRIFGTDESTDEDCGDVSTFDASSEREHDEDGNSEHEDPAAIGKWMLTTGSSLHSMMSSAICSAENSWMSCSPRG